MIFQFHSDSNYAGFVHDTELLPNAEEQCQFDPENLTAVIDDGFVEMHDLEYEAGLWGGEVEW